MQDISTPYSNKDVLLIREFIHEDIDFETGHISAQRPQVGWTVREILKKRKGICGEGTRLLFHILRKDGIQSRRIYLHGNRVLHVILEYSNDNDDWILLETINGPGEKFKNRLDSNKMTLDSLFNYGPYRFHVTPKDFAENFGYYNYSYLPFNGMFNNNLFKTEIYVHKPMPGLINYFLEKHEAFFLLFFGLILFLINIKYFKVFIINMLYKNKSKI